MQPDLAEPRRLDQNILNFLWRDIFTLRKLEDIFGSVDDFDGSIWEYFDDIACLKPSILRWAIERLSSLLWILEVAGHDGGAPEEALACRLLVLA